ncbi:MAG: hypothetical protein LAT67_07290 [Balneolales bacterium]|nr:hypothetical protein [Balneolales bacterium]
MKYTYLLVLLGFALVAFSPVTTHAQQFTADQKRTLENLSSLFLVVEFAEDSVEMDGLSRTEVELEVAQRLRSAGIRLMNEVEWSRQPGVPYLYVYLNSVKSELGFYSYRIHVQLNQEVRLIRNPNLSTMSTTWERGILGLIGVNRVYTIRPEILRYVDEFIQDYQNVNLR